MLSFKEKSSVDVVIVGDFPQSLELIRGGVQASMYGLAKVLSNHSEVKSLRVVSLPSKDQQCDEEKNVDGIQVMYMSLPLAFLFSGVLRIPTLWLQGIGKKAYVHHVHGTGWVQALMIIIYRLLSRRFVWTVHGIVEKEEKDKFRYDPTIKKLLYVLLYTGIERMCLILTRQIIVDTPYVQDVIANRTRATIHVIPQGIFCSEFRKTYRSGSHNIKSVVSLGVIARRKGHHFLLQAFRKAWDDDHDLRLIILGSVTEPDYLAELEQIIIDLQLSQVAYIHANAPREKLISSLSEAGVFALHSEEESQGIAICEALAAGLPVIATSVGGIPHVVKHQRSGLLSPFGDVDNFAKSISQLTQNAQLYEEMARNALEDSALFDWSTIAKQVLEVYRRA